MGIDMNGHTERMHRLLVLWLDLYSAMTQAEPARNGDWRSHDVPWKSTDARVQQAWRNLTAPGNQLALEQWLCQSADGPPAEWACQALQVCRERRSKV